MLSSSSESESMFVRIDWAGVVESIEPYPAVTIRIGASLVFPLASWYERTHFVSPASAACRSSAIWRLSSSAANASWIACASDEGVTGVAPPLERRCLFDGGCEGVDGEEEVGEAAARCMNFLWSVLCGFCGIAIADLHRKKS